ncbi:hypothetical protein ES702_00263 [subsurface metagenome]
MCAYCIYLDGNGILRELSCNQLSRSPLDSSLEVMSTFGCCCEALLICSMTRPNRAIGTNYVSLGGRFFAITVAAA